MNDRVLLAGRPESAPRVALTKAHGSKEPDPPSAVRAPNHGAPDGGSCAADESGPDAPPSRPYATSLA